MFLMNLQQPLSRLHSAQITSVLAVHVRTDGHSEPKLLGHFLHFRPFRRQNPTIGTSCDCASCVMQSALHLESSIDPFHLLRCCNNLYLPPPIQLHHLHALLLPKSDLRFSTDPHPIFLLLTRIR